jgi:hypothetical protein
VADPPRAPAPGDDITEESHATTTGMPRWVKVSLIVVAGLVVLFVALKLSGLAGEHGPGRHSPGRGAPPSDVVERGGHRPPAGIPDHGG